ncbi:hypothetical protein SAMN04489731_106260 [Amycolatopsis regifaucium]|nr:hypothetical protein SAMN04489731_106260 [Amycolatopsis regifaucium]
MLQGGAQRGVAAVDPIPRHPRCLVAGVQEPRDHAGGQFGFGGRRGVRAKSGVFDSARGAGVLALDADGVAAHFHVTGLVNNEHRLGGSAGAHGIGSGLADPSGDRPSSSSIRLANAPAVGQHLRCDLRPQRHSQMINDRRTCQGSSKATQCWDCWASTTNSTPGQDPSTLSGMLVTDDRRHLVVAPGLPALPGNPPRLTAPDVPRTRPQPEPTITVAQFALHYDETMPLILPSAHRLFDSRSAHATVQQSAFLFERNGFGRLGIRSDGPCGRTTASGPSRRRGEWGGRVASGRSVRPPPTAAGPPAGTRATATAGDR